MTGKIIFTAGKPKEVTFENEIFTDPIRLIDRAGIPIAIRDKPQATKFHPEGSHLIVYIQSDGIINGRLGIVAEQTVAGDIFHLPYVESITHSVSKEKK